VIEITFNENSYFFKKMSEISKRIEKRKNKKKRIDNETSLTLECKREDIAKVNTLINKNTKLINKKNDEGDTPLIIACKKENKELVECLLNQDGIDKNMFSNYDINPLLVACYFKNKDLVDILVHHEADITIKDNLPLHIACYLICKDLVEILTNHQADINLPLHIIHYLKNSNSLDSSNIIEYLKSINNELSNLINSCEYDSSKNTEESKIEDSKNNISESKLII